MGRTDRDYQSREERLRSRPGRREVEGDYRGPPGSRPPRDANTRPQLRSMLIEFDPITIIRLFRRPPNRGGATRRTRRLRGNRPVPASIGLSAMTAG